MNLRACNFVHHTNDALYVGAYLWYFLLCIRARFCAVHQSHTEKENLPGFVLLTHSLVSRSCSSTIWTIFRRVCVSPRTFPGHPYFAQGHNRVGGGHWTGCFRGPCAEKQLGTTAAPRAGPMLTLPWPRSAARAVLRLHRVGGASAMAMCCLARWQPEDLGSPVQPPQARAVAGSKALSIVSKRMASAGTAACSFMVWSSESPPCPHFY